METSTLQLLMRAVIELRGGGCADALADEIDAAIADASVVDRFHCPECGAKRLNHPEAAGANVFACARCGRGWFILNTSGGG